MQYVKWDDAKFSVGLGAIDAEHRTLVRLINDVYRARNAEPDPQRTGGVLARLVEYARTHFAGEEQLMGEHGFPDRAAHAASHRSFEQRIERFLAEFEDGEDRLADELLHFLRDWLRGHVQHSDRACAAYLIARGVAS